MEFYVSRVLFPAILIDILLTVRFLRQETGLQRNRKIIGATAPLYLIAAIVWMLIFGFGDAAFQGQGAIGLILLGYLGVAFTVLRVFLGFILFMSLRNR